MTAEQWTGIVVSVIVALGGGAGIAPLLKWMRGPEPQKRPTSLPPPPTHTHATREELVELRAEIRETIEAVEDALRTRLDQNVRELIDRLHALALRVEAVVAARAAEERHSVPSRRGGGR